MKITDIVDSIIEKTNDNTTVNEMLLSTVQKEEDEYIVPDDTEIVVNIELTTGSQTADNERYENTYEIQAGEFKDFAMENPKGNWLFCNGREVSRIDYKSLFDAIGVVYGDGDGVTTFNIPDMRGMFKRCLDAGRGIDKTTNRVIGSYENMEQIGIDELYVTTFFSQYTSNGTIYLPKANYQEIQKGVNIEKEVRPVNIAVYTCIRY